MNHQDKSDNQESSVSLDKLTECFAFDELDKHFAADSLHSTSIQQHIDSGCVRCSAYLDILRERRERAKSLRDRFLSALEEQFNADFPYMRKECNRLQGSADASERLVAARMRYALGVDVEVARFFLPRRLQDHLLCEADQVSLVAECDNGQGQGYKLLVRECIWEDTKMGFVLGIFPIKSTRVGAELIINDGTRIPLTKKSEEHGEMWVTPRITADYLPLRGGQWLVAIELFSSAINDQSQETAPPLAFDATI